MPHRCLPVLLALLYLGGCASSPKIWNTLDGKPPIIIAHRGDSGNFPEHTEAAYRSAMQTGVDYIELDIVLTRDGVAVCRHDLYLSTTTDIVSRPEFAGRKREYGGRYDWFVFDFAYDELKALKAVQPVSTRDQSNNGQYGIPTLWNMYDHYEQWRVELGLPHGRCGLYIELKKPAQHLEIDPGLDVLSQVVIADGAYRMSGAVPPKVFLQCFDRETIEELAAFGRLPLPTIWLTSDPIDLDDLPEGIDGLGINKDLIQIIDGQSTLVEELHERGLLVHVWTFRDDRLQGTGYDNAQEEIEAYLRVGVDGVFTDFPETGLAAREQIASETQSKRRQSDAALSERIRRNSPRRFIRRY